MTALKESVIAGFITTGVRFFPIGIEAGTD